MLLQPQHASSMQKDWLSTEPLTIRHRIQGHAPPLTFHNQFIKLLRHFCATDEYFIIHPTRISTHQLNNSSNLSQPN